jgi:hypothetical protein
MRGRTETSSGFDMSGRPLTFSQNIADEICDRLSEGKSLISICKGDDMPPLRTVKRWLVDGRMRDFQAQYAVARDIYAEHVAEEIIDIADNEPDPHRARVMIDARKWIASKLLPKKYGDRQQVDVRAGMSLEALIMESYGETPPPSYGGAIKNRN